MSNIVSLDFPRNKSDAAFDYSVLSTDDATLARVTVHKIRQHQRRTVGEIIDIGVDLKRVKDALGRGRFGDWINAEFGWTDRTARNYMQAAEVFGAKSETFSELPPAIVYKIAAPSTPAAVREEIIQSLDRGDHLPIEQLTKQIETARDEAKLIQAESKLTKGQRACRKGRHAQLQRRKQEYEQERERESERAAVVATELVQEFGTTTIKRILDATDDWTVRDALRKIVGGAS